MSGSGAGRVQPTDVPEGLGWHLRRVEGAQPDHHRGELDEGEVVRGKLVVAGRHATISPPSPNPSNEPSPAMAVYFKAPRKSAIAPWRAPLYLPAHEDTMPVGAEPAPRQTHGR